MFTVKSDHDNDGCFEKLLLNNIEMLTGFSRKLTRESDNANDLVQKTLMKDLEHREKFREVTNFRVCKCTILSRINYEQFRNRRREIPDPYGTLFCTSKSFSKKLDKIYLIDFRKFLKINPNKQQAALMFVGCLGYSYEEAAVIPNFPFGNLKSLLSRLSEKNKETPKLINRFCIHTCN